jgi:uncharacterized protein (TIGR02246 family)
MRRICMAVAKLSLILVTNGWSQTGPTIAERFLPQVDRAPPSPNSALVGSSSRNEKAVRKTLADFVDIWNARNMQSFQQSFGSLFTDDADFVVIGGLYLKGREEIVGHHIVLLKGPYRDSHLVWNPVRLKFVGSDVAVAEVATEITFGKDKRTTFATIVLVQQDSKWLITALENVLMNGPPVGPPPPK